MLAILDRPLDPAEYLWHGYVEGTAPDTDVLAEVRALRDSAVYADFAVTQLDPRENDTESVLAIRVSDLNSILDREAGR